MLKKKPQRKTKGKNQKTNYASEIKIPKRTNTGTAGLPKLTFPLASRTVSPNTAQIPANQQHNHQLLTNFNNTEAPIAKSHALSAKPTLEGRQH